MQIIIRESLHGKNVFIVELTPEERAMPEKDLVSYVDNGGGSTACNNFGGTVEYLSGNIAKVTVYID